MDIKSVESVRALYEQDILLWVEHTVTQLKNRDFEHLDLEHLIVEVEALGIAQKHELISRLTVLLEHLLKRLYVDSPYDFNGWERTISHQRNQLEILLAQAPSLRSLWPDTFERAWLLAGKTVRKEYRRTQFPKIWPYNTDPESLLNTDFWEVQDQTQI